MNIHIKTFESYYSDDDADDYSEYNDDVDGEKITISTSSHVSSIEVNEVAFSKLTKLLLSEENPQFDLFNNDEFYLDSTSGYISIIPTTHLNEISNDAAKELNDFIRLNLTDDSGIWIYIGTYLFKK